MIKNNYGLQSLNGQWTKADREQKIVIILGYMVAVMERAEDINTIDEKDCVTNFSREIPNNNNIVHYTIKSLLDAKKTKVSLVHVGGNLRVSESLGVDPFMTTAVDVCSRFSSLFEESIMKARVTCS